MRLLREAKPTSLAKQRSQHMCSSSASYTAFTMSLIALLAALVVAASCSSHSVIHVKEEHDVQHIIHQSWRDENVPVEHVPYISTWKDKHPGWIHKCASHPAGTRFKLCGQLELQPKLLMLCRLWTDEENEALVSAHYPWCGSEPCTGSCHCCTQFASSLRQYHRIAHCRARLRKHPLLRFKDTYDALPKPIMKADACRALYMHFYGGVLTASHRPLWHFMHGWLWM